MNVSAQALIDFITDFELKNQQGITSFIATVQIYFRNKLHISESNVQVITSDQLGSVYLMDHENDIKLPDLFNVKSQDFAYVSNQYLRIISSASEEKYIVSVFPKRM